MFSIILTNKLLKVFLLSKLTRQRELVTPFVTPSSAKIKSRYYSPKFKQRIINRIFADQQFVKTVAIEHGRPNDNIFASTKTMDMLSKKQRRRLFIHETESTTTHQSFRKYDTKRKIDYWKAKISIILHFTTNM